MHLERKEALIRHALGLARSAEYNTEPNPMVGAVLTDAHGNILAEGCHHHAGGPHAEVECLKNFTQVPADSILFVTLEPCAHHGKTPPCAELLVAKGVRHVVIGTPDPNPLVAGKGIQILQDGGLEVELECLEEECRQLNHVFNCHIQKQMPYIALKAGITLDGKIAMESGESQWITGVEARAEGQQIRSQFQAILVGKRTLLLDNPRLDNRNLDAPRQPFPIVLGQPEIHPELNFFQDPRQKYWLTVKGDGKEKSQLSEYGIELIQADDLTGALKDLYGRGIASIMVEGGAQVNSSLLKLGLVDELILFIAPRLIGQNKAPGFIGDFGLEKLSDTPSYHIVETRPCGTDLMIRLRKEY